TAAGTISNGRLQPEAAPNIFAGSILDPSPDRRLRSARPRKDVGDCSGPRPRSSFVPLAGRSKRRAHSKKVPVIQALGDRAAVDSLASDSSVKVPAPRGWPIQATKSGPWRTELMGSRSHTIKLLERRSSHVPQFG